MISLMSILLKKYFRRCSKYNGKNEKQSKKRRKRLEVRKVGRQGEKYHYTLKITYIIYMKLVPLKLCPVKSYLFFR